MTSRNNSITDLNEENIPIPLQLFLWSHLTPFVRPKLGKHHEASCMSFEKVLVQNLKFGLSISQTEAIESIPRWRLIQCSLPHVMHALASLLHNRVKDSMQSLGTVETKLLYTLHWILLDASDECVEADLEKNIVHTDPFHYLFSIPTMTLFVYLFAPISHHLKESDFTNYRLENGLKIWQPMWEFRHPEANCFSTHVKPKPKPFGGRNVKKNQIVTDVFLGRKLSKEDYPLNGSPASQSISAQSENLPTSKQTSTEEEPWVSSPKDTIFPETIPEESSSIEEEQVIIYRLPSMQSSQFSDPSVYAADPSLFQSTKQYNNSLTMVTPVSSSDSVKMTIKPLPQVAKMSSSEKESVSDTAQIGQKVAQTPQSPSKNLYVSAATFLDVATLRCMFVSQWQEGGVYWALHYLYNRLRDISDDISKQTQPRKRSNSLPIPKIEVSIYQSPEMKKRDSLKNFMEVPELREFNLLTESHYQTFKSVEEDKLTRRASEKTKRRKKISDLRAFVETKLLSKSEKALEKIGQDDNDYEYNRSSDTNGDRPSSALGRSFPTSRSVHSDLWSRSLIKGKSMPSLRYIGETKLDKCRDVSKHVPSTIQTQRNPIITVTEHTPTPSPDYTPKSKQGSLESQLDSVSMQGSHQLQSSPERKPSLTRSQTDSNITYIVEELSEAHGSSNYITKDGDIDFFIVLKAAYSVSTMDTFYITLRVVEVLLNLVDILIDIGVLKKGTCSEENEQPQGQSDSLKEGKGRDSGIPCNRSQDSSNVDMAESVKEKTQEKDLQDCPYYMIMNILMRVLRQLGCSHGCKEATRGPQAECLRVQARNTLNTLRKTCQQKFTQRLKEFGKNSPIKIVLATLHSCIGFCIEPLNQQKRGYAKPPEISHLQQSYASNFGAGIIGVNNQRVIENAIVESLFRILINRFALMQKELRLLDNAPLYTEIRNLINYVKEVHGGIFRLVALTAMFDTAERPDTRLEDNNTQATRVVRHIPRQEYEERSSDIAVDSSTVADDKNNKKFNFKKRSTSSTCASVLDTDGGDETSRSSPVGRRMQRHDTQNKSKGKFHLGGIMRWFRQKNTGSLHGNGGGSGESLPISGSMVSLVRPHSHIVQHNVAGRTQGKRRVGHTFNRAKRQVEDRLNRFGLKKKKKDKSIEETPGGYGEGASGMEGCGYWCVAVCGRKVVSTATIYRGLSLLNVLLEATQPGTLPDPLLVGALLDLPHTPEISRACTLLEISYLIHNCNKGQWPNWMRSNISARPPASVNLILKRQRTAARLFYQWAEAIGNRLEQMLTEDKQYLDEVAKMVADPEGQRELLQQDEEEDFLDQASLEFPGRKLGASCSRAMRMIACILLFEITAFLRESYQNIPKSGRSSIKERAPWDRVYREANRRWSMALSSMGHSQNSAQSLQSIACVDTERKISFVLHEPENVSGGSSNATLAEGIVYQGEEKKCPRLAARAASTAGKETNKSLHRTRGNSNVTSYGSFKRRSIKLRHNKDRDDDNRRAEQSGIRRKVSSVSDRSDTSEVIGPGWCVADDSNTDSPEDEFQEEIEYVGNGLDKNMPWLKTLVKFMNSFNYSCSHQNFCHPYCFTRNMRSCARLVKAVHKVYGEKFGPEPVVTEPDVSSTADGRRSANTRKSSDQTQDRIEKSVIESGGIAYRATGLDASGTSQTDSLRDKLNIPGFIPYPPTETPGILKYIKSTVSHGSHAALAALLKGATVAVSDVIGSAAAPAWDLLLESHRDVCSCAAAIFILAAVRSPTQVTQIMNQHLKDPRPDVRINAILRFQVLWKLRYQVWPRMEDGASMTFKVPPPGIEFTLPSPKIGIESLAVVDPPWSTQVKDKDMEMTLNQERHRSLVTATKTRKKQKTEAIKKALQQHNDKKKAERERFLITTIPITRQAASEPSLEHTADDHIEPDEEMLEGVRGGHHTAMASALFPSALCSAVSEIVALLDDAAVSHDGCSVYEVAYQVIWSCLVEDSALFLRSALEKVTRAKPDEVFKMLRHLIRFVPRLPQQAAFALYNYIIGYVMFYVRSPHPQGQRLVGAALSLLWMVVHSVHGIMFKDLKQILRKEQCDASILLTANVPSAKKIVVHGPQAEDEGGIPTQFSVQEDTQFSSVLRESLDFFGIPESLHKEYFLLDYKTRQIHNPQSYIRDHYFFKRSQYPQLELVHMKPDEAFDALQQQELLHKFVEIGKVLLTWAILKNVDMVVQRVVFLHEELMKLPSFPRKALEADLDLYNGGQLGPQLLGLDVLHKFMWVRLIARMFEAMAGNFAYSGDIHLFLNVLNGALMLHSEDALILRYVIATYVNAAFNFKNIFSTNGYLLIMPTLLQIYSNYESNKLVRTTIEYAVKQFYLMNRKPFILQMFGSVSAILDHSDDETLNFGDSSKVQSSCLFNLLLSLETPSPDPLHIAELIKEEKPLKPIDFCYRDEDEMVNVLDCISLCVMVVSYSAESMRGYQMLVILAAILPCYVKQIQLPKYNKQGKTEKEIIDQLAITVRTLVTNCEGLAKAYNGPYRTTSPEHKGSSQRGCTRTNPSHDPLEDDSLSRYLSDHSRVPQHTEYTGEDSEWVRTEYRRPRDVLLLLVSDFLREASARLAELNGNNKGSTSEGKSQELLDSRCHIRLVDIAHSLLKVSPYDPESMGSRGLQRYMMCVLPSADWSVDTMKTALCTILRRLDKVFLKISKKNTIRKNTDWDSAAGLLKGMYETMSRCPYIMNWPLVKTLINTIQSLVVCGGGETAPPHFASTVVRLLALYVLHTGDSSSLEQMCGGTPCFSTPEKTENMLMNLLMPLCLRVGSGRKDVPTLCKSHISFMVTAVLNVIYPTIFCKPNPPTDGRNNSITYSQVKDPRANIKISVNLYRMAFLALKMLCACFQSEMYNEWPRIARTMKELNKRNEASNHLWDFLEYVVTYRTPLFILLIHFIVHKLNSSPIGETERRFQFMVSEKLQGRLLPTARSRGAQLTELARNLHELRITEERGAEEEAPPPPPPTASLGKRFSEANAKPPPSATQHRPSLISTLLTSRNNNRTPTPDRVDNNQTNKDVSHSSPPGGSQLPDDDFKGEDGGSIGTPPDTEVSPVGLEPSQKLKFVSAVEFKFTTGETSTTPVSSLSPTEEKVGLDKPRLQRSNIPSKKTFKFRRSKKSKPEADDIESGWQETNPIEMSPHSSSSDSSTYFRCANASTIQTTSEITSSVNVLMPPPTLYRGHSFKTQLGPLTPSGLTKSPGDVFFSSTLRAPSETSGSVSPNQSQNKSPIPSDTQIKSPNESISPQSKASSNELASPLNKMSPFESYSPQNKRSPQPGGSRSDSPTVAPRRPLVHMHTLPDTSCDSESQLSRTSSTSGYRENYSIPTWTPESPRIGASSQDSRTHSPEESLSCNDSNSSTAERTALLGTASQRSLLTSSDIKDEDTLI